MATNKTISERQKQIEQISLFNDFLRKKIVLLRQSNNPEEKSAIFQEIRQSQGLNTTICEGMTMHQRAEKVRQEYQEAKSNAQACKRRLSERSEALKLATQKLELQEQRITKQSRNLDILDKKLSEIQKRAQQMTQKQKTIFQRRNNLYRPKASRPLLTEQ